jgi:hypothetical protein
VRGTKLKVLKNLKLDEVFVDKWPVIPA